MLFLRRDRFYLRWVRDTDAISSLRSGITMLSTGLSQNVETSAMCVFSLVV
jgi:hypothetical protein